MRIPSVNEWRRKKGSVGRDVVVGQRRGKERSTMDVVKRGKIP